MVSNTDQRTIVATTVMMPSATDNRKAIFRTDQGSILLTSSRARRALAFGAGLTNVGGALGLQSLGKPARVLAVAGDGSSMYSIAELATAKQHNAPVTWLIVDDGGYGILREYMIDTFGKATHTELARPDFVKLAESFGVPAQRVAPEDVGAALKAGFAADGPNVVVVDVLLKMFGPTHLDY